MILCSALPQVHLLCITGSILIRGVKGNIKDAEVQPPTVGAAIFAKEKQQELQEDLERQFSQGLRK